jgi:small subunit ribosomal protein S1
VSDRDERGKSGSGEGSLQQEYVNSFQAVEEGQLLTGQVIEVGPELVYIDVGLKSEGRVPVSEFTELPEVGQSVEVVLLRKESRSGDVIVSRRKAEEQVLWRTLKAAAEERTPIQGIIRSKIKGGYEVDLGSGTRAFVPFSKVDIMRVRNEDDYLNLQTSFFVEQLFSKGRANVVVNRRDWLEQEIKNRREQFYSHTEIGDVVDGAVKSFTSFGAFVDLGGFDGLLHVNDMRWGHVASPKDAVVIGEEVNVKVIRVDRESQKVNLSLKHFTPDPWTTFEERYALDDLVTGKVTKTTDFGAFIEIEAGIEGLLHISDMSWVKKIGHPREILGNGDEVQVKILAYDLERGKLSLGLKHVLPNPWDTAEERFPPGKIVTGVVRNITSYGAFVQLEEGIDGLLHVDDMSWTKKVRNPASVVQTDQELEVAVVDLDKKARRIRLGLKQLSDDPWVALARAFRRGSVIEGQVTSKTDFGVFLRVQGGIEGLIANNQLADPAPGSIDKARDGIEPGAQLKAVVTEVSAEKQRLSLSLREFQRREERQELVKYIHDDEQPDRVSLGEFLKDRPSH